LQIVEGKRKNPYLRYMAEQIKDPGIGEKFNARSGRVMNKDGSFNVRQAGFDFRRLHLFQFLIRMSWANFFLVLLVGFAFINLLFAGIYLLLGESALKVSGEMDPIAPFWRAFFFSLHTLTTVGYGNFYPSGYASNALSGVEAMLGLLGFAVATGLVYGRFSRPTAKMIYSKHAIIAPYKDHNALMLRVANFRDSLMMEVQADITFTYVVQVGDEYIRKYYLLPLERNTVLYLPLTWTMVHPITDKSPLFGKTKEELKDMQIEIMVKLKGFDEGFGEHVHSRNSYMIDEVVWGAKFLPSFHVDDDGATILDFDKVGAYEKATLNKELAHIDHVPALT
jgi:inward rectifier potassium channel